MKVVLVYNAKSGSYSSLSDLKKACADAGVEIITAIQAKPGFESLLKRHIKKGETIAVAGGDGSISAAASLLTGTKATLMPLPGGTLNHFTKDLGIPQSLPEALAYFNTAKKVRIDTAQVNGKTFINNSSVGVYSDSLLHRDEHEKKYGKWPAMLTATFTALFRFRTYRVEIGGKHYRTPLVFVGNNRYELDGFAFQRAKLWGGTLCVYIVIGRSRLSLLHAAIDIALGKKNVTKRLKSFTTEEVSIQTKRPVRVSRDGEHEKMSSPLRYSVEKSSLWVLRKNREK